MKLGYGNRPALSPDGKSVACIRRESNASQITILPTGAGEARTFPAEGIRYETVEWFPDGKHILFTGTAANQPVRTYMRAVSGGEAKPISDGNVRLTRVSPDGRGALVLREDGAYLQPFTGGEPKRIAALNDKDTVIRWHPDGRALFVRHDVEETGALELVRLDLSSGRRELLRSIKPPEPGAHFQGLVTIAADGRSYAYSYQRDLAILYQVSGLR